MPKQSTAQQSNEITLTSRFFTLKKREIKGQAELAIQSAPNLKEVYAAAKRLEEFAKQIISQTKEAILSEIDEPEQVREGELSWRGGGVAYSGEKSFGHWERWTETRAELDRLEGLMKSVAKAGPGTEMIDTETGEVVPPAKPITKSPYLTYSF